MSTAAAWDSATAWDGVSIDGVTVPGVPIRRPRLVVIDGGRSESARGHRAARPLTLPRPVRLAMTLSVVGVAVLGLAATLLLGIGGAASSPAIGAVEVRPGQTLSEIARAEMPGLATAEAVARIQLANNLPSTQVTAGQTIVIPGY